VYSSPGFFMPILRLHPKSKTVRRDQEIFTRLIGECITRWAFIDRALFEFCSHFLGGRSALTAIVYYRTPQLRQRLGLVDELFRTMIAITKAHIPSRSLVAMRRCDEMLREWKSAHKELERLSEVRNAIAHQPMGVTGTSKKHGAGIRAHYFFYIRSEFRDADMRNRKIWTIRTPDLRVHFRETEAMVRRLRNLLSRLARLQKRSANRPFGQRVSRRRP
jgi:hypothetical protein